MKKIIYSFIIMIMLLSITACLKREENKDNNIGQNEETKNEPLENATDIRQGNIELKNVKITVNGAISLVQATLTNTGSTVTTFDAVLYLENASGLILGKVSKRVDKLEPNQSRDISVEIMGDYTAASTYQLTLENVEV